MQPEKPESQVKLQLFLPAFALLFASRLNGAPVASGNTSKKTSTSTSMS